ncbi:hypothetical protein RDI58_010501 [Solanum bulbocastanum]|uniref:Uncharacterized protein n=1 Tax=Solanum bulbocastanum TaxID=147425 RepID=A0AAN8TPE7_SOLBU
MAGLLWKRGTTNG